LPDTALAYIKQNSQNGSSVYSLSECLSLDICAAWQHQNRRDIRDRTLPALGVHVCNPCDRVINTMPYRHFKTFTAFRLPVINIRCPLNCWQRRIQFA